jgi:hypothetical protein
MARRKAERGADLVDEWRLSFFPFRHRVACFRCADVARGTWHAMAKDEVSHAKTQRRHQGEAWAVHSMARWCSAGCSPVVRSIEPCDDGEATPDDGAAL